VLICFWDSLNVSFSEKVISQDAWPHGAE
jgi:hypothetical protein